ncbi:MazG-like family protein [Neorhizobium sp. LjRoot104]|uniref:MazG-like family protein n=1 Tax=Neorhizobium sp. LjRoot104 TaxID=3342254 RepID=UPI003ECDE3CA
MSEEMKTRGNLSITKEWFERRAKAEADLEIGAGFSLVNPTDEDMAQMEVLAERSLPQWAQNELARLRAALSRLDAGEVCVGAVETQTTINEWISETFGEAGSNISVAARANQEMAELIMKLAVDDNDREAIEEVADVVIVLYRLVHRFDADMAAQIDRKMTINRARKWNVANGHGYHVKATPSDNRQSGEERE